MTITYVMGHRSSFIVLRQKSPHVRWIYPCPYLIKLEDLWRSGYIDPDILDLGNRWRWVVSSVKLFKMKVMHFNNICTLWHVTVFYMDSLKNIRSPIWIPCKVERRLHCKNSDQNSIYSAKSCINTYSKFIRNPLSNIGDRWRRMKDRHELPMWRKHNKTSIFESLLRRFFCRNFPFKSYRKRRNIPFRRVLVR
jgi:hypothetical protein